MGVVVVVDKGCGEVLVGDLEGGGSRATSRARVLPSVWHLRIGYEENTEEREHRRWVC